MLWTGTFGEPATVDTESESTGSSIEFADDTRQREGQHDS